VKRSTILRLLSVLAVLALLAVPAVGIAQEGGAPQAEPVVVPNFWDPRSRLERPSASEIGAIRFLTTDDFPPFAFRDHRDILIGFDVDLARAICEVLEVQCAIQVRPFNTLVQGLEDGTGNAIIAGFDPERAGTQGLIATQAYLKIPGRFVIAKSTIFDPEGPTPERFIGVVCDSAHAAYVARFFPDLRVACFLNPGAALKAVKDGVLAAAFGDALSLAFWLHGPESEDCCRFSGGAYLDNAYFGTGLAIAVKAEDRTLKFALDYALREVYRNGTYEELYLRYFPVSLF
jgi:polar amino acid transport system substrate-binding protein